MSDYRDDIVRFLRWEVVGPETAHEVIDTTPLQRYTAGILFPQKAIHSEVDSSGGQGNIADPSPGVPEAAEPSPPEDSGDAENPAAAEKEDEEDSGSPAEDTDDAISLANSFRPSAMGLSFMVECDGPCVVRIAAEAARYVSAAALRSAGPGDGS